MGKPETSDVLLLAGLAVLVIAGYLALGAVLALGITGAGLIALAVVAHVTGRAVDSQPHRLIPLDCCRDPRPTILNGMVMCNHCRRILAGFELPEPEDKAA